MKMHQDAAKKNEADGRGSDAGHSPDGDGGGAVASSAAAAASTAPDASAANRPATPRAAGRDAIAGKER